MGSEMCIRDRYRTNVNWPIQTGTSRTITNRFNQNEDTIARVRARNARGFGPWSAEARTVTNRPAAPGGVTAAAGALADGSQPLVISWNTSNANGFGILRYEVEYQVGTTGATATATQSAPATHTHTQTHPCLLYTSPSPRDS